MSTRRMSEPVRSTARSSLNTFLPMYTKARYRTIHTAHAAHIKHIQQEGRGDQHTAAGKATAIVAIVYFRPVVAPLEVAQSRPRIKPINPERFFPITKPFTPNYSNQERIPATPKITTRRCRSASVSGWWPGSSDDEGDKNCMRRTRSRGKGRGDVQRLEGRGVKDI